MRRALVALLVLATSVAGCGSGSDAPAEKGGSAGGDVKIVPIGGSQDAASIAVGTDAAWIGTDGRLLEADPESGAIKRSVKLPVAGTPGSMAVDETAVWLVIFTEKEERLVGVDAETGQPVGRPFVIPFQYPIDIVAAGGYVWIASNLKGQRNLYRYDPRAGKITKRIPNTGNIAMAGGEDGLWLTSDDGLVRVDPAEARVTGGPYKTPTGGPVAVADGVVWTPTIEGALARHDATSGDPLGQSSVDVKLLSTLEAGPLGTWISDSGEDRLLRLDPETGKVSQTIEDVDSHEIAVGEQAIYATADEDVPSIYVIKP